MPTKGGPGSGPHPGGGSAVAELPAHEHADKAADGILAKFGEKYAAFKAEFADKPGVIAKVATAYKLAKGASAKQYANIKERYGAKGAIAIFAAANAISWGGHAAAWAAGIPVYIPGSVPLSMAAIVAVAEQYKSMTGKPAAKDAPTLSDAEAEYLGEQLIDDIGQELLDWIGEHADEWKAEFEDAKNVKAFDESKHPRDHGRFAAISQEANEHLDKLKSEIRTASTDHAGDHSSMKEAIVEAFDKHGESLSGVGEKISASVIADAKEKYGDDANLVDAGDLKDAVESVVADAHQEVADSHETIVADLQDENPDLSSDGNEEATQANLEFNLERVKHSDIAKGIAEATNDYHKAIEEAAQEKENELASVAESSQENVSGKVASIIEKHDGKANKILDAVVAKIDSDVGDIDHQSLIDSANIRLAKQGNVNRIQEEDGQFVLVVDRNSLHSVATQEAAKENAKLAKQGNPYKVVVDDVYESGAIDTFLARTTESKPYVKPPYDTNDKSSFKPDVKSKDFSMPTRRETEFLKSISDRARSASFDGGIRLASEFATRGGLYQYSSGDFNLESTIKELSQKLVYADDDMQYTKAYSELSQNACMDFEAVITSTKKDRDGDVLESKGAEIDPRSPLLWQHMPTHPIGKFVSLLGRDEWKIKGRCAIADTQQGRDAAVLVDFGALRISHGFKPFKFAQLEPDGTGMMPGYRVEKFKIFEVSLVSVPSNDDAIITAFSRQKLHDPFVKSWAKSLWTSKGEPVVGGYDAVNGGDGTVQLSEKSFDALTAAVSQGTVAIQELREQLAAKSTQEQTMTATATKATAPDIRLTKSRKAHLAHAKNLAMAAHDHEEMGGATTSKALLQAACGKIGDAMKPAEPATTKTMRLTQDRQAMLGDAKSLMMQAHDHDEMKDAAHSKSMVKGAHGYIDKAMQPPMADDDMEPSDIGEPNPAMDADDISDVNPGIDVGKSLEDDDIDTCTVDVTATKFLSAVIAGDVDWQTLYDAKNIIDGAIERMDAKAIEDVLIG